jgi:3-phosphoshikimate 1-carboxyvinyltransferase
VEPGQATSPADALTVAGDWSGAAFWLAAGALSEEGVTVTGLDTLSAQGDRQVLGALSAFGAQMERRRTQVHVVADELRPLTLNVKDIPDLVMPLAAVAAYALGTTTFEGAARLRLKESDRLASTSKAIASLGGKATFTDDALVVEGTGRLSGGTVDAAGDHRIAMMAAVAAAYAEGPSTIVGAECVEKSYPTFWEDFKALGGNVTLCEGEG